MDREGLNLLRGGVFAAALLGCSTPAHRTPPQAAFIFEASPHVELLSVVQALARPARHSERSVRLGLPYLAGLPARFAGMGGEPAVLWYDRFLASGGSELALMESALYLTPLPELSPDGVPEDLAAACGGVAELVKFVSLLREFAAKSRFDEFFESNRAAYSQFKELALREAARDVDPARLRAYLGADFPFRIRFVLAPLFDGGPFSKAIRSEPGAAEVWEARFLNEEGGFVFDHFGNSAAHALAHGVTEPWARVHAAGFEAAGPPPEGCLRSAYNSWSDCIDEHVVVAVMVRLQRGRMSAEEYAEAQSREGLPFLPAVLRGLEEYESARGRYPSLGAFLPRIADIVRAELAGR